jgi:hypothetical protein
MKPRPGYERQDLMREAAHAMADLTTFDAIVTMLEGSIYQSASRTAARKIIKICKAEQQKRLEEYDGLVDDVCSL